MTESSTEPGRRARAQASLKDVSVVSFDLDDTFWDCAPAIERAERVLYDWMQKATPRITVVHDPQSLLRFRADFRKANPQLAGCVTAMRVQGLQALLAEFDYDESLVQDGFDLFYRARSDVTLYAGVTQLLESLADRYRLAAITNGNADLGFIGIEGYFDKVLAANLEVKAKPAADMFDQCCSHFDIEPENLLHVGDNQVTDILGAMDAGAQSLWFNQFRLPWQHKTALPHYEAQDIGQVRTLLTAT